MDKKTPPVSPPQENGIFGIAVPPAEAEIIYLPVPWDATTSYGAGTVNGPSAIFDASFQLDFAHPALKFSNHPPFSMLPEDPEIRVWNTQARHLAEHIIQTWNSGDWQEAEGIEELIHVNQFSDRLNEWVYQESKKILDQGKILALVGGDHSVPYGAYRALAEKESDFGILHLDAHLDLRQSYQGFNHSHASIMFNTIQNIPEMKKLVQVGIRDFAQEEVDFAHAQEGRIKTFFDYELAQNRFSGKTWRDQAKEIIAELPENVWISFDIDGLDPRFCPHTGTPVPGGLDFHEASFLFSELAQSGKKILGFDLVEVSPPAGYPKNQDNEWDANVGMRMLYQLSLWTLVSHGKMNVNKL
jgi:agmatinase